ncbi:protein kinase domain-containing protein [Pyxidicoccus sp. 3LFB2]
MGKYQLLRKLATGGMAEVFLAKSSGPLGFEKHVVVKRILPHLAEDPQFVEMFLAEAKLAARLNHANIVQIFDFGMEGDSYFIAMEYVDGVDLRTLKRRAFHKGAPIAFPLCARLVSMACEGLAYAHELTDPETGKPLRLIHRDISPDNIFASKTGGLKILDFGIAKASNAGHRTESGVLKGKVPYMAPEYLLGEGIDARIDIYALGVVLFELVTGNRPYRSENDVRLIQAVLNQPLPDVRNFRQGVPQQLVHILNRALAKERDKRYGSCREFQADLDRFLYLYSDPVGATQIASFVQDMSSSPSPGSESTSESIATTPEPRLLLDISGMEAPESTTQPKPTPAPTPSLEDSTAETRWVTAPIPSPPAPPAPPPAQHKASSESATARLPGPPRKAPPSAALMASEPRSGAAQAPKALPEDEDEDALKPQFGWLQRNVFWWAPAVLLALGVGAVATFAREDAPQASPEAVASPVAPLPPTEEADAGQLSPPATASAPPPLEEHPTPSLPPDAGVTHTAVATTVSASPVSPSSAPEPEKMAMIRVTSNLPGEVRVNGISLGRTPLEHHPVKPGKLQVSIKGIHQGDAFNKEQILELVPDESREIAFRIQRVNVTIRGRPEDLRVEEMDAHALLGQTEVLTYEGQHRLLLVHPTTGKQYRASCTATPGEKLCRFFVKVPR